MSALLDGDEYLMDDDGEEDMDVLSPLELPASAAPNVGSRRPSADDALDSARSSQDTTHTLSPRSSLDHKELLACHVARCVAAPAAMLQTSASPFLPAAGGWPAGVEHASPPAGNALQRAPAAAPQAAAFASMLGAQPAHHQQTVAQALMAGGPAQPLRSTMPTGVTVTTGTSQLPYRASTGSPHPKRGRYF